MQVHFFSIPLFQGDSECAALNRILQSHRIVNIEKHLVPDGRNSIWTVCVTTLSHTRPPDDIKRERTALHSFYERAACRDRSSMRQLSGRPEGDL